MSLAKEVIKILLFIDYCNRDTMVMVQSARREWEGRSNCKCHVSSYQTLALKAQIRECLGMPVLSKQMDTSVSLLKVYQDREEAANLSRN